MPDTVNIVPYTGPALDCAGPGYFEGVCTAAGEPQQNVMIQAVHSVTGAPAGHTVSGPDGRWRLEGVNPTMDFDSSLWDKPVHFVISNDSKSSWVRDLYFFINGKMIINKTDLGMRLWIGGDTYRFKMSDVSGFGKFYGVFHNFRITRNVARYTKDFYPPNKQFPIIGP